MEESIKNDYIGLVDYKDLEENILSSYPFRCSS